MKSSLNSACVCALLCGVVIIAMPAFSQTVGAGPSGAISGPTENTTTGSVNTANADSARSYAQPMVGGTVSTGGVSASGDINSADAANNAGSINHSTQASAGRTARKAENRAHPGASTGATTR